MEGDLQVAFERARGRLERDLQSRFGREPSACTLDPSESFIS